MIKRIVLALKSGILIAIIALLQTGCTVDQDTRNLDKIEALLNSSESEINIERAVFMVDRLMDPTVDIDENIKKVDALHKKIIAESSDPNGDIATMNKVLFEPGPWNDNQIYRFDLTDPFGDNFKNFLVSRYLDIKLGNCLSMPMLYYIIGKRMGYELFVSNAPIHVFLQGKADDHYIGIEVTRKAKTWRLEDFVTQWKITEAAKANKLYYRRFNKKGIISGLLVRPIIHYMDAKKYRHAIRAAKLALKGNPKNHMAMLNLSDVYVILLEEQIYLDGVVPNAKNREDYYNGLVTRFKALRATAKRLGYRRATKEELAEIKERARRLLSGEESV